MKKKPNSKRYYPNIILVMVGVLIIFFSAYNIINLVLIKEEKSPKVNTLENEYYVVGKDPTTYQKEIFNLLSDELSNKERNYKNISELVAKSFVIDFFGWSNKDYSFDIGGLQYMRDPETFFKIAQWEYYQKLDVFNSTYDKGKLPKVQKVYATTSYDRSFAIDDQLFDTYTVLLNWSYDYDANLDIEKFIDQAVITLIEDQGKVSIVEIKMVEEEIVDE